VRGTPYEGRDWLYALPPVPHADGKRRAPRFYVVPAAVHGNMFVEIIDFGRSHMLPNLPSRALDAGIRFDFQKALYGHLQRLDTGGLDPWTSAFDLDPAVFVGPHSQYAYTRMTPQLGSYTVQVARDLCTVATIHTWPARMADLWKQGSVHTRDLVHTFKSLNEAHAAFPNLLHVGSLAQYPPHFKAHVEWPQGAPTGEKRPRPGDAQGGGPASKKPRLACVHCKGPSMGPDYCGAICQAISLGHLAVAPRLGHLNAM
jgi:hypothetical protein